MILTNNEVGVRWVLLESLILANPKPELTIDDGSDHPLLPRNLLRLALSTPGSMPAIRQIASKKF
ncbi:hypothetical protein Hanom_Chr05g00400711 [Helianthus anomalus]